MANVLVFEDSEPHRLIARLRLERAGHSIVAEAGTLEEAAEVLRRLANKKLNAHVALLDGVFTDNDRTAYAIIEPATREMLHFSIGHTAAQSEVAFPGLYLAYPEDNRISSDGENPGIKEAKDYPDAFRTIVGTPPLAGYAISRVLATLNERRITNVGMIGFSSDPLVGRGISVLDADATKAGSSSLPTIVSEVYSKRRLK